MDEDAPVPASEGKRVQDNDSTHPGLVSHVDLSFVALDLEDEVRTHKISIDSARYSQDYGSDGVPDDTRHSLGQIKVQVKTYSQSEPPPDEVNEVEFKHEELETPQEMEHETEIEQDYENLEDAFSLQARVKGRPSSVRRLRQSRLSSLKHQNEMEDGSFGLISPTTPPSTPRRTYDDQDTFEYAQGSEYLTENDNTDEVVQSPSQIPVDEELLRQENVHSILLEKECVVPEVFIVWENVCKFIINKMLEGFGVRIPGLGTFSYSILPSDIINKPVTGKYSLRKTRKFPVFKICPHLKEMYRLTEENHLYQCNVSTLPLNLAIVASNAKLSRGLVDGIIIETLQSFVTGIITNKNLEFPFPFIGKLYIRNRKAFMIFYEQFCEGLSFEFSYAPSYITSVFPGNMTPLTAHRPAIGFHSVFHFCDVRSVEEKITAKPRPYAKGKLIRGVTPSGDPCEFEKQLFTHSNLLYDCSCCKSENPGDISKKKYGYGDEKDDDDFHEDSTGQCGYSKNYDRIRRACTQPGNFTFKKPDGSTFSPEPLFKSSKTGNPILDRLADDRCLLQQAIGNWMKKKVVETLGCETIVKHHDRNYFRRDLTGDAQVGGYTRKSYLVRDEGQPRRSPSSAIPSPTSSKRSVRSGSLKIPSPRRVSIGSAEERLIVEEEAVGASENTDDSFLSYPNRTSVNVKNIRSKSYRKSKYPEEPFSFVEEDFPTEERVEVEGNTTSGSGRESAASGSGRRYTADYEPTDRS